MRTTSTSADEASFTEQNGTNHIFLLNGELINSIDEINKRYSRNDVKTIGLIPKEESLKRFNVNDVIAWIETFDKETVTKK